MPAMARLLCDPSLIQVRTSRVSGRKATICAATAIPAMTSAMTNIA
jgi:hypothetical protein